MISDLALSEKHFMDWINVFRWFVAECLILLFMGRFGKQENCYCSAWGQRSGCVVGYNQDKEAKQARCIAPQICDEEGVPPQVVKQLFHVLSSSFQGIMIFI